MRGFLAVCCVLLAACTAQPETKVAAAPGGHILSASAVAPNLPPPLPAEQTLLIDLGYYPVQPQSAATETRGRDLPEPPLGIIAPSPARAPQLPVETAQDADLQAPPTRVAGIQALLDEMGYAPGPIDGIMGPLTRAAIDTFQTRLNLELANSNLTLIAAQLESARLVPEAQQLLTELGYVPGAIDGVPGPLTRAAMAAFQIRYGLEGSGIVSADSLDVLRTVTMTHEIQIRLAGMGYDPGPADGVLGPRTKKAILFFERDHGLPPIGWAPAVVRERLREAPYIEQTQRLLTVLGYDAGPVTARDNARTRAAISTFQGDANRPLTGRASADLLLAIHDQAQVTLTPAAGPRNDPNKTGEPQPDHAQSETPTAATPLLAHLMPLAEEGAPSAQHLVAGLYMRGQGVPIDLPVAFDWYERAANQGFAPAQFRLGLIYAFGLGTGIDESAAGAWFKQAAMHGHPGATQALAMLGNLDRDEYPSVR